jgi:Ca2+-binding EF-hand superfamily protein
MADSVDQFRAILRLSASEASKTIATFVSGLFEFVEAPDGSSKMLTFDNFEKGICVVKDIRRNMKRTELAEIFEEIDESGVSKISLDDLIDFCERSISRARILALKLRKAIRENCQDTNHYIQAFASISGGSKFADPDSFRDFAEDMLPGVLVKENDSLALYGLFDCNGDGKVSLDDFLAFIQPVIPDASRVLERINPECIIDVKISQNATHNAELVRQGYLQITPGVFRGKDTGPNNRVDDAIIAQGTFGKGQSLWIWKAKQGTCGGKLKPIVDVQLETSSSSTALIISGYICLPTPISGQWVWLKRATTIQEELDSIVDFQVRTHPAVHTGLTFQYSLGYNWSNEYSNR